MNVIKQIVKDGQTIKMIVKDNERGPKGDDGAIHYTAGAGIYISPENVISTRGAGGEVLWGDITGTLSDQTDLKNALDAKQDTLHAGGGIIINGDYITATASIIPKDFFSRGDEWTSDQMNGGFFFFQEFYEGATLQVDICGNGRQDNTPSPTNQVPILPTTGTQTITIGKDLDDPDAQTYTVRLGSLELNAAAEFPFDGEGHVVNDTIFDWGNDGNIIYKAVGKVVLDGSSDELWEASGDTFYVTLSDKKKSEFGRCDYFEYVADDFSTTDPSFRGKCTGNKTATGIYFMPLQSQTLAEFKAWLSSNPITVCYLLAEPTFVHISDSNLLADLATLKTAHGYLITTCVAVSATSGNMYCSLRVGGKKSTLGEVVDDIGTLSSTISSLPTVNNATLTIQQNNTNVATFTANSSTNVTANITTPVITMTSTDPGEGQPLAANNFIAVYEP